MARAVFPDPFMISSRIYVYLLGCFFLIEVVIDLAKGSNLNGNAHTLGILRLI